MTSPRWRRSPISARTSPAATPAGESTPGRERWAGLGVDIAVVYGHLTTPRGVSDRLPAIDQTWGNFTTGERSDFDIIDRFLANVDDDRQTRGRPTPRHVRIRWGRAASSLRPFPLPPPPVGGDRRRAPDGCPALLGPGGAGWGTDTWLVGQGSSGTYSSRSMPTPSSAR